VNCKDRSPTSSSSKEAAAAPAAASGVAALAATVASACCVGPVLAPVSVSVLGASGAAWAAGLKPYSPSILAGSLALLLYGFRPGLPATAILRHSASCSPSSLRVRLALWIAAGIWVVSAAANVAFRILTA
jgi:hypothetical protein